MKDAETFLEKLEELIEAMIDDKGSDHIEDRVYYNQVRADFLQFLKAEA